MKYAMETDKFFKLLAFQVDDELENPDLVVDDDCTNRVWSQNKFLNWKLISRRSIPWSYPSLKSNLHCSKSNWSCKIRNGETIMSFVSLDRVML